MKQFLRHIGIDIGIDISIGEFEFFFLGIFEELLPVISRESSVFLWEVTDSAVSSVVIQL